MAAIAFRPVRTTGPASLRLLFLAHAVEHALSDFEARLGPPSGWLVEWKYDGIRAQLVKRAGQVYG